MGNIIKIDREQAKELYESPTTQTATTPPADEPLVVWECQCGCRLFYLTKYGHLCSECDTIQVYG